MNLAKHKDSIKELEIIGKSYKVYLKFQVFRKENSNNDESIWL